MKIPVTLLLALIGTLGKSNNNSTRHSVGCVTHSRHFVFYFFVKKLNSLTPKSPTNKVLIFFAPAAQILSAVILG